MITKNKNTLTDITSATDRMLNQPPKRGYGFLRTMISLGALVTTITLSACSATTSTPPPNSAAPATIVAQPTAAPTMAITPTATTAPQPTSTPTQASTPANASMPEATFPPTALDPCVLIDSQAASTLAGTSFGQGVESTNPSGLNTCTYGGNTSNVFTVEVAQAPDANTAQAYKSDFLAEVQANAQQLSSEGLNVTQLPNFADGAVQASMSVNDQGVTVSGSAFGLLKGTVFCGFTDIVVGGNSPSDTAMQSEANTVLGSLP